LIGLAAGGGLMAGLAGMLVPHLRGTIKHTVPLFASDLQLHSHGMVPQSINPYISMDYPVGHGVGN
jgi:hypothetical protein